MGNVVSSLTFQPPKEVPKLDSTAKFVRTKNGFSIPLLIFRPPKEPTYKTSSIQNKYQKSISNSLPYTFIFSHGNSDSITLITDFAVDFVLKTKSNFVLYEYCGYPYAEGEVSFTF
ncbi:hypothetical protein M0811_10370 [Anaeramoeba ignava]|uniref:Uncharacterized protein n=1 Tax=Anaeramoeba ignava TaxID=1746090 RepID=A0A9Q0R9E2_ANAIG|nr:hypothetical protein M0811_10370 [Anaeramoeba ignava]